MFQYYRLAAITGTSLLLLLVARCLYHLTFHPLAKYPGPKLAALTEYWYAFAWASGNYPNIMLKAHQEYGNVVRTGPNKLSFATVQAHHDIYGHKPLFPKSEWYSGGRFGGIVFERRPEAHVQIRKALAPHFRPRYLRENVEETILDLMSMVPRLLAETETGAKDGGAAVDICRLFTMIAFDVIGMITMGKTFDSVRTNTLHPLADIMHSGAYGATLVPLRNRLWLFDEYIQHKSKGKDPNMLRSQHVMILKTEIDKRTAEGGVEHGDDIVAQILREKMLSETVLFSNIVNLLIAGSETVATCLSTAVWLLSQPENRRYLTRVREEVRGTFGSERDINGESAARLPFLKAVIDETLRLVPPSPFGQSRSTPQPGAMVDGRHIPGGTDVSVDIWTLQKSSRYWADADQFRPERWLDRESLNDEDKLAWDQSGFSKDDRGAFQPFSEGPRSCPGQGLTYLEVGIVLARIVWVYDWKLVCHDDYDWMAGFRLEFMWRKPPLMVKLFPRAD
ncbi:cytochrome P450 [Xylariaceae sp. FL0255]|nr:cytochrome P450 [Xylariaceae sp. FL0255]